MGGKLNVPIVILAGGRGSRLGELTTITPKPLVKVGSDPIIMHLIKWLLKFDVNSLYILTGYLHEEVEKYFLHYPYSQNKKIEITKDSISADNFNPLNCKISLINTGLKSGTAYRLKLIKDELKKYNRFIVIYGDGLANVNIDKLLDFHDHMVKNQGTLVTITANQPYSKYGVLDIQKDKVIKFREKPKLNDWINIGFMVMEQGIFDYMENIPEETMFVDHLFSKISKEGKISVYKHTGEFKCMDTYKDYMFLNELWKNGKAFWI